MTDTENKSTEILRLAENKIKSQSRQLLSNIFMETENSKTNEPHKFVYNFSQRSIKLVAFQNLSIYYKWKNMRQQYQNTKLEIIAPTLNDTFELLDASHLVSDIQNYIEYIIKKRETLTVVPPIHTYINRINNISVQNKRWVQARIKIV